MSFRVAGKRLRCVGIVAFLWFTMPTISWAQQSCGATFGTPSTGSNCCQSHHCPPAFNHCVEGPPCICWKHGCPHPICDPCNLPHWGFWEKCWNPYPFPPNWTHCPAPPPSSLVNLNPLANQGVPALRPPNMLPPTTVPTPPGSGIPSPMPNGGGLDELAPPRRIEGPRPGL